MGPHIYEPTNTALGLIEDHAAESRMRPAWDEIDRYAAELTERKRRHPDESVLSNIGIALRAKGFDERVVRDTYATLGTGWPTPVPVLAASVIELIQRPPLVAACRTNPSLWTRTARRLVSERSFFALASPRMATETIGLAPGLEVRKGQVVLPSVAAALQDPTSTSAFASANFHKEKPNWGLAFGAGANRCPFVAPSMILLPIALEVIFTRFNLRLAVTRSDLHWQKALLAIPKAIPVLVDHRPGLAPDRTDQEKAASTASPV